MKSLNLMTIKAVFFLIALFSSTGFANSFRNALVMTCDVPNPRDPYAAALGKLWLYYDTFDADSLSGKGLKAHLQLVGFNQPAVQIHGKDRQPGCSVKKVLRVTDRNVFAVIISPGKNCHNYRNRKTNTHYLPDLSNAAENRGATNTEQWLVNCVEGNYANVKMMGTLSYTDAQSGIFEEEPRM
jgi:hypothetical protein